MNKSIKQGSNGVEHNSFNILIVGFGVVGHNLAHELKKLNPIVHDIRDIRNQGFITKEESGLSHFDIAFICTDTPYVSEENPCDMTQVYNAIEDNDADIYVIKSTCMVGNVDMLKEKTGKHIVFSPEYYGGTQHCNDFDFDFTILGGDKKDCTKVVQILQEVYDGRHKFHIVDAKTAEMVKYMENSFLATKVSFCVSFFNMCKKAGINYEELRELFILDPRVNPSHTFVYEDHPYWKSHCLSKDVPSIAIQYDNKFLKSVIEYNELCKNNKNK